MSNVGHKKSNSDWELTTMERRYSVPPPANNAPGSTASPQDPHHARGQPPVNPIGGPSASEDLHAWSIYRSVALFVMQETAISNKIIINVQIIKTIFSS